MLHFRWMAVLAGVFLASPISAQTEEIQLRLQVKNLEAEVKRLRERIEKLEALLQPKTETPNRPFKITVLPGDWGASSLDNIEAVCRSAVQEWGKYVPNRNQDPISIRYDKRGPMVIFGQGSDGERRVLLHTRDLAWAQLAYQFAHEYCHIQCNYREGSRLNLWFEESLCETASLFVLRKMAETWKVKAPYSNWKSYAPSLHNYAQDRIKNVEPLNGLSLAQWYQRNEEDLRKDGTNRAKNQVAAAALLPLFEKNPHHWQAVRYLNLWDAKTDLTFAQYLREWSARVPEEHRPFLAEVAEMFGQSLK